VTFCAVGIRAVELEVILVLKVYVDL